MADLLTKKKAAELVGVSEKTIQRWIAQEKLEVVREGRVLRVVKNSLSKLGIPESKSDILIISCEYDKEILHDLIENRDIISVYRVSGNGPLWFATKGSSFTETHKSFCKKNLSILNWSRIRDIPGPNYYSPENFLKTNFTFWVCIDGEKKQFQNFLDDKALFQQFKIEKAFSSVGPSNFLVKAHSTSLEKMHALLIQIRSFNLATTTKIIMSVYKENSEKLEAKQEPRQIACEEERRKNELKLHYCITRVLSNNNFALTADSAKAAPTIETNLSTSNFGVNPSVRDIQQLLVPKNEIKQINSGDTKNEDEKTDLHHPIQYINKYSIKFKRVGWHKTIFFIKANTLEGTKEDLEEILRENFLGITGTSFASKLYQITGYYDFCIPIDLFDSDEAVDNLVNDLSKPDVYKSLVKDVKSVICKPYKDSHGNTKERLNPHLIPFVEALLINSTKMKNFEISINKNRGANKEKNIYLAAVRDEEVSNQAWEGITPRELYVVNQLKYKRNLPRVQADLEEFLNNFKGFESEGIFPSVELKEGGLIQALVNFSCDSVEKKWVLKEQLEQRAKKYELIVEPFEPREKALQIIYIIVVSELVELENLFSELEVLGLYRKVDFQFLTHQNFISRVLEQSVSCKPCLYPYSLNSNDKEKSTQSCEDCTRYISNSTKGKTIKIDLAQKRFLNKNSKVRISIMGVNLSWGKIFALEKIGESKVNEILERISVSENGEEAIISEDEKKRILSDYNEYSNMEARENYKDAIKGLVSSQINSDFEADILIFPEYSIPKYLVETLINPNEVKLNKDCLIVAGSHIFEGYNRCPLIISEGKRRFQYYTYKNVISNIEKGIGLITNFGTAFLKFQNSNWGNFIVQICSDLYQAENLTNLRAVDLLLVPSCNTSKRIPEHIKTSSNNKKLVGVYANTLNLEQHFAASQFFIPDKEAMEPALDRISSFHTHLGGTTISEDSIFKFYKYAEPKKLHRIQIGRFIFFEKWLEIDLAQLDLRRNV